MNAKGVLSALVTVTPALARAKSVVASLSLLVFAVTVLLNWSIVPSDKMAARMLRYALDNGRAVYRPDGTVREVGRDSVAVVSVTDCWRVKDEVFYCAMRFSDRGGEEYLAAFETSWDRGSASTNVDNYRVVELTLKRQREILVKRKMLRPQSADLPSQTIERQADFRLVMPLLAGPVPDVRRGFAAGTAEDAVEIG